MTKFNVFQTLEGGYLFLELPDGDPRNDDEQVVGYSPNDMYVGAFEAETGSSVSKSR